KSQNEGKEAQGQQSQNQQDSENKKEKQEKQETEQHQPQRDDKQVKDQGEPIQAKAHPEKMHQDDPEFRRLEAVESARDPSFLIRAQMQLQAQQKQPPQQSQKEW
ncbi:TPA: hypothetical protein ACVO0R_002850, partial [Vibrio alginolyticus]|nr:hypothetical protein [Vibrio alginolyticus]ELB2829638.1 hypothetical protein [Vibrio alginolyticus]ELB2832939.1 hypothetical protein [Vibrio alginolyticus]EMC2459708.1 hypothetical protein [Vibrio alginolyticus]MBT0000624.1 hypothetical protein [Vibrio alginolyticus]